MVLCERCAAIMAEEEREEKAFARVIPLHLKLYDFGDSVTTMPIPDFSEGGGYLTSSICFLQDLEEKRFLGVRIDFKSGGRSKSIIDSTNILERLEDAVLRFDAEAVETIENAGKKAMQHG